MKETFKKRLSHAMSINHITQTKLADQLGISKSMVNSYVQGLYKPKQNALTEMASIMGVNEAWLMGYDVPMTSVEEVRQDEATISYYINNENCAYTLKGDDRDFVIAYCQDLELRRVVNAFVKAYTLKN